MKIYILFLDRNLNIDSITNNDAIIKAIIIKYSIFNPSSLNFKVNFFKITHEHWIVNKGFNLAD